MYVSAPMALHPKCDLTHAPIFDVLKSVLKSRGWGWFSVEVSGRSKGRKNLQIKHFWTSVDHPGTQFGAGDGNRTHGSSLGSLGITIIRRPRRCSILVAFRKIRQAQPIEAKRPGAPGAPREAAPR